MMRLVLLRMLETYYRHRWLYLLPILVLTLIGVIAFLTAKPMFISRGVLYVQKGSLLSTLTSIRQDTITFITPAEQTAEEIKDLMETDAFIRAVIRQTNLEAEMADGHRVVRQIMRDVRKAVWVRDQGDSQVMIAAAYEDPEVAHQLATATIESYIQWRINADRVESVAAQAFFADLIAVYQAELDRARNEMEAFLELHPEPLRGVRPTGERVQLARLESSIDLAATRFASALDKEEDARLATAQAESDVRQSYVVIDSPRLADEPERSLRETAIHMLIYMGAGLILTVAAVVGGTLLDRSFRFPLDVHHHLELPVLAQVPGPAAAQDPVALRHNVDLPVLSIVPGPVRNRKLVPILSRVEQLCRMGEKGLNLAADNVSDPGLKTVLKSYAQERGRFAAELQSEGARRGLSLRLKSGSAAAVHRGWMNIKGATTVGETQRECAVLRECLRGERATLAEYRQSLHKNLPVKVQRVMLRQYQQIKHVHEALRQMSGETEVRLLPRLFGNTAEAEQAVDSLRQAGFEPDHIDLAPLNQLVDGRAPAVGQRGQRMGESAGTGALLGALIGLLGGIVVGGSIIVWPGLNSVATAAAIETILTTALAGTGIGILFGALMGALIGLGVAPTDEIESLLNGAGDDSVLLTVQADEQRAEMASRILTGRNGRGALIDQPVAAMVNER